MARFSAAPKQEHMKKMLQVFVIDFVVDVKFTILMSCTTMVSFVSTPRKYKSIFFFSSSIGCLRWYQFQWSNQKQKESFLLSGNWCKAHHCCDVQSRPLFFSSWFREMCACLQYWMLFLGHTMYYYDLQWNKNIVCALAKIGCMPDGVHHIDWPNHPPAASFNHLGLLTYHWNC